MSPTLVLAWVAFGYVLLQGVRYMLGARIYLTCALRQVEASPVSRQQIDPGELRLLMWSDEGLAAAGFRHLGFASVTPLITYYGAPLVASVFANDRLPAYVMVRRHLAPEYGRLVELEIRTVLASGAQLLTVNTPFASSFLPPRLYVEVHPGLSLGEVLERHAARVAAARAKGDAPVEHATLGDATRLIAAGLAALRAQFRERIWVVPTADPSLDRFTLRGALALTHYSRRVFGARSPVPRQTPAFSRRSPPPVPSEEERSLRVEADYSAVVHVADNPEAAPGTPWPLITVIAVTAVLSLGAMALLWNLTVAALILAAVAFHEAGHALAMRRFGYRDVHVFFVPLLGAMTVGRPATTTVRDRLAVMLAGPVPGLWLAVVLLAINEVSGPMPLLRMSALALLILNGLNLLPFTPIDGGRALEALSGPESVWRLAVHGASAAGLIAVAVSLRDPVFAALSVFWALILPRQFLLHRLRRSVAATVQDRGDFRAVVRAALEVMSAPRYAAWRAATRQLMARTIARLFAESVATPADRRWGALAYVSAWIPAVVALLLLAR